MVAERILVVDDEPGVRSALQGILEDEGFEVDCAETGEQGLERLQQQRYDAVLLDVWLPGDDGLVTLKRLRERNHDPAVVMISGHGTIETAVGATKLGAFDFVEKPLSLERTLLVLRNALRQRTLERTNSMLLKHIARDTEILGDSGRARELRRAVEIAASSDAHVLILGPYGSGRERVARRIHAAARAADAPFVELPAAALDSEAQERALFGEGTRRGRIDHASGGILYIEDVDRLAPALQRRLAAAIADRARREPGLRVLASATAEPADEELAHALGVLRIEVPALRERGDDIPTLAERFMRDAAREYGREPKRLAPDALQALAAWDWPGNVRELRNLVERLLLFVDTAEVGAADLPAQLTGGRGNVDLYGRFASLEEGVAAFERYHVRKALEEAAGDLEAAASRLHLAPEELKRRVETLGTA